MSHSRPAKTRDPARTRAALLRAGIRLFAAAGYDGVAVGELVAQAGCSKRMLYHYFGSKEGLYVEVLREAFGALARREMALLEEDCTAAEAISRILESSFQLPEEHPEFVSLLIRKNLAGGRFLDAHPGLLSKSPVVARLGRILSQARRRSLRLAKAMILSGLIPRPAAGN